MKAALTIGDAARFIGISGQQVIRLFDAGEIAGFRVPGSRHRRITPGQLREFLVRIGAPTDALDAAHPPGDASRKAVAS